MQKSRIAGTAAAALLGAAMIFTICPDPAFAKPTSEEQQKIDAAALQKKKLEDEREKTQSMISELNSLKSDLSAYVTKLDSDLSGIEEEIDRLNGEISGKEDELKTAEQELTEAEKLKDQQFGDMKLRIKYLYEKGDTGFLDLLFSSKNVTEFFNCAEYVTKITRYDRDQLDIYADNCHAIEQKKVEIAGEKADLESLRTDQMAKEDSVKTLLAEKQKQIASYTVQIGEAQSDLSQYDEQIEEQEDEIRAVEAQVKKREEEERKKAEEAAKQNSGEQQSTELSSTAKESLGSIHFIWPCPASSTVTSGFGSRNAPTKGASSNHKGIDISAATGSAIVAAADGEVVIASYSASSGNYVMISHGGGVYTLYLHCSKLDCSVGDHVAAGQTIAEVGSTGISTGPHLHFAIRSDGTYLNPLNYVSS